MSGEGLRAFAADLRASSAQMQDRASQVVRKVALDTERDAKAAAPVKTGNLKNSITTRTNGLAAGVVATASYAHWVEGGTSRMAAQPFMGPAADRNAPGFVEAMGRLIE